MCSAIRIVSKHFNEFVLLEIESDSRVCCRHAYGKIQSSTSMSTVANTNSLPACGLPSTVRYRMACQVDIHSYRHSRISNI